MRPRLDRGNIETPRDETIVLSFAIVALCPLVAAQADPAPEAPALGPSQSAALLGPVSARTTSVSVALRDALDELPEQTALAIVIPEPSRAMQRLRSMTGELGDTVPELSVDQLVRRFRSAAFWIGAAEAGIDLHGRVTVVVGLDGAPDVLRMSLTDPKAFAQWARSRGRKAPIAQWGETEVWALVDDDAACVLRDGAAWCQLGPSPTRDPLAELRHVIDVPTRRLSQLSPMAAAATRLPATADAYVISRPSALGSAIAQAMVERARAAHRFAAPSERRALELDARAQARRVLATASLARSVVSAIALGDDGLSIDTELTLSERGAFMARALVGPLDPADPILTWADTPSLGRVVARVDPALASDLLALARVQVPTQRLNGTLAVMVLGLDTQCPSAKASGPRDLESWPFVFPLAGAIGLAGDTPVDRAELVAGIGIPPDPRRREPRDDVLFRGRIHGSPIEARLAPGTILVGTGHGAGSAAARRWSAARPPSAPSGEGAFLDARVSLVGVGAALTGGAYDGDTRPDLRRLERAYRLLAPVLARYPMARATSRLEASGERLRVQVSVGQ